jgi:hypothetical protein
MGETLPEQMFDSVTIGAGHAASLSTRSLWPLKSFAMPGSAQDRSSFSSLRAAPTSPSRPSTSR